MRGRELVLGALAECEDSCRRIQKKRQGGDSLGGDS